MSRNFELLKRAEEERQIRTTAVTLETDEHPRPVRPLPSEIRQATPPCTVDASRPGISEQAAPEIMKLVQNLFTIHPFAAPRVALFSPVTRSERPDFIAAQVAEAMIDQQLGSIALLDADVARPSLHAYFSVDNRVGFTNLLVSEQPLQAFGHGVQGCELTVITAGPATRNWANLLGSETITERLRMLRTTADFVIINAPPVAECPAVLALGQRTDGVVLIVEAHITRRELARKAKQQWENSNTRLLGAVLNNRTFPIPDSLYARL